MSMSAEHQVFTLSALNGTLMVSQEGTQRYMTRIIAVANQKGGVGKTTTAVNVAASLASEKQPVLLIDLDPQGNATSGLGLPKEQSVTTYEVLRGDAGLEQGVMRTRIDGLYILAANPDLAAAEIDLVDMDRREFRLQLALQNAAYDYIIIDCPPALGLLTINALTAATDVLIPVQTEYYALEGLGQLLGTVQRVREATNPRLDLLGVVLTMYDKRTSLSEQVKREIETHFGDKLFTNVVPRNIRLAESPSYGKTIFEHDKWSKGARAYKNIAKEVQKRTGGR